ncbi:MAG: hypothetical protein ACP6IP_04360 [Candidatus Njordarchaeia archaeon]
MQDKPAATPFSPSKKYVYASFSASVFNKFIVMLVFQTLFTMPLTGFRVYHSAIVFATFISPLIIGAWLERYSKEMLSNLTLKNLYIFSGILATILLLIHLLSIHIIQLLYSTALKTFLVKESHTTMQTLLFNLISIHIYIATYSPTIIAYSEKIPLKNNISWTKSNLNRWKGNLFILALGIPLALNITVLGLVDIYQMNENMKILATMFMSIVQILATISLTKKTLTHTI